MNKTITITIFIMALVAAVVLAANASLNISISTLPSNESCNESDSVCQSWGSCDDSIQFRTCTIYNSSNVCGNITSYQENRSCTNPSTGGGGGGSHHSSSGSLVYSCNENLSCGNWSECSEGFQTRICKNSACGFKTLRTCESETIPKIVNPPINDSVNVSEVKEELVVQEVEPVICPEPQIVYVENNSTAYEKFVWWVNHDAPPSVKGVWNYKYSFPFLIAALILIIILSAIRRRHKIPKPVAHIKTNQPTLEPRLIPLYNMVRKQLASGYDKFMIIEFYKTKHVNDSDLEKVFGVIEG